MKFRGMQAVVGSALASAGVLLGAYGAQAQGEFEGPTTVHSFTASLKGAVQDENNRGRESIRRESANQRDLARACLGRSLRGREKIVLVTDCGDTISPFQALVLVVDTNDEPAEIVTDLGRATLLQVARKENGDDDTTEVLYSIFGELGCDDTEVEFTGFAKASFKQLDPSDDASPICVSSANGKALGGGEIEGEDAVLEHMNFTAGGRSKNIEVPAEDINLYFD